jgi:hypothetical protein
MAGLLTWLCLQFLPFHLCLRFFYWLAANREAGFLFFQPLSELDEMKMRSFSSIENKF